MEIDKYRQIVQSILEKYADCDADNSEVETQIAFDLKPGREACR
ncbi:MAG: element excision factor XisI family protein [Cyanobacteria bacterium J06592_8]